MSQHIRNSKPSEKDCKMTYVTVVKLEYIFGSVLKNQSSGEKWLLSEVVIDIVKIFVY